MNCSADYFSRLQKSGRKAFVPYLVAGYPNKESTAELLLAASKAGVQAIELGIPFSDPIADGPTLQKASFQALENGITLAKILEILKEIQGKISVPVFLMGYVNPFLQFGWKRLVEEAVKSGVSGLIIPDLPLEESRVIVPLLQSNGLCYVPLCAPTTQPERIQAIGKLADGFVYLVSVKGVTGARSQLPSDLENFLKRVKRIAKKPVYVGFGVSTKEQARRIASQADGVIMGSRLAKFLEEHRPEPDLCQQWEAYLRSWVDEMQSGAGDCPKRDNKGLGTVPNRL